MDESQPNEASANEPASAQQAPAEAAPPASRAPRSRNVVALVALLAALGAIALAAASWYDVRGRIDAAQQELARRVRDIDSTARDARSMARDAQEATRDAQAKVALLESKLAASQSQQAALQGLYQELTRNRSVWQLAEVEQVLETAQRQLKLSGNVRGALLALQLAHSRLAGSGQAQFEPVLQALGRDIKRLQAYHGPDLPGLSGALDRLASEAGSLPLAAEQRAERAEPAARPSTTGVEGRLARFGAEVWGELRQLLIVRRLEHPEPPLLPPSEAYFVRQNLALTLLNARLSLLIRDQAGYRGELRTAQAWIGRYFDPRASQTAAMLTQLKRLSSEPLDFETPSISDSLEAVRRLKALGARGSS